MITKVCAYCNRTYHPHQNRSIYCGRKCAGLGYSVKYGKSEFFFGKRKKPSTPCLNCSKPIQKRNASNTTNLCRICFHESKQNIQLKDINPGLNSVKRFRALRCAARYLLDKLWDKKQCHFCFYNKHVEVCHIKAIVDFPETALLKEVNDKSNLILLCPTHHWELDHNLLDDENKKKLEDYIKDNLKE